MKKFMARYETKSCMGSAVFETENEMYVELECEGIVEEDDRVVGIDYYELEEHPNGSCSVVRRWDYGKPYMNDYWRKVTVSCIA